MAIVNSVVCYNNEEEIIAYAKSLEKQKNKGELRLVVSVNKNRWNLGDFKKCLQEIDIQSYVYEPKENLGYLNGMIYGYGKYIEESGENPRWAVFSNTDIQYQQEDFFLRLAEKVYPDEIWLMGPSVLTLDGNYSNPMRMSRYSKRGLKLRQLLYSSGLLDWIMTFVHGLRKSKDVKKPEPCHCYMVHGCYLILRKELADLIVAKNPWELMYMEENYLAEECRLHGKSVYYESELEVLHEAGTVTNQLNSARKRKMNRDSIGRILRDYYE